MNNQKIILQVIPASTTRKRRWMHHIPTITPAFGALAATESPPEETAHSLPSAFISKAPEH